MIIKQSNRLKSVHEYYFSRKLQEIREMETQGHRIINLGIGSPDLAPSENTLEELNRSARQPGAHGYQSYKGIPELLKAIASFMSETYGTALNHETEILPLMGSKEGITHISLAFLNKGDKVLIPDPGYPTYSSVTRLCEAKPVYYSLKEKNHWLPDLEKISRSKLKGVKLMWINYPHMPTGAEASDEGFRQLIAFAKKNKILLCHDNPYSMVLNAHSPKSILNYPGAMEVAIELNSLSKSFNMAGWRVGWVAGHRDYLDTILKVKSNVDSGMFKPIQKAAVEALKNPPSWHTKRNEIYKARREKAWELLHLLECDYSMDQTGMFVWARLKNTSLRSEAFADKILKEAHVFITPGSIFGKNGEGYVRVSLCSDLDVFDEAISRIRKRKQPSRTVAKLQPAAI